MKSKKLISFLCAAAMTTSAFAGLTVASAAATPVWSFDGSSADDWDGDVKPTVKTDEGSTDQYLDFLAGTGTKSNNTTFVLPTAAQLENDYVLEYDAFIHTGNGMGRLAQYTQLAFTGASPVQDSQDYGGDYAAEASPMMEGKNCDCHSTWNDASETGWGYAGDIVSSLTNRIELQGKMLINYDGTNAPSINDGDAQVGDSKWVRVRNEVKDGKAKVTIADSNGTIVDGQEFAVSASKLSQIKMAFGRADTTHFIPTTPANIKLDNIKVYDGIAGTPAFSTADLRKSAVVATPIPAPEKVAGPAPKFYAPETAENPYVANFNDAAVSEIGHVETAETDAKNVVNGMKVKLGNRDSGEDAKTYASIVKVADGDNAVRLSADKFSTNGRGPVVSLDNNIDLSDATSGSAVMSFAVYLSKTDANGIERLFLLDNTDNVDGNGCARDVVAVITTEDIQNEDESYKYTAGDSNIGIHVEPEAWHTITVVATAEESPVRIFVDGKYEEEGRLAPALKVEMVGTGEGNKHAVTHLPMIAIENTKAYNEETGEGGTVYSTALIDNVLTYYVQGDLKSKNLPQTEGEEPTDPPYVATPAPKHVANITYADGKASVSTTEDTPFDGVLIAANYRADGTLEKIALTKELTGISSTAIEEEIAMAVGDKLMVWNNLKDMVPYGTYTVQAADTTNTPAPANTPVPTVTPTATPEVTADPNATTEPKYEVTVATAENGTVTADKTTAAEGETVTLTVTPKMGYTGTVTVKDADNADVTVTDNKFTMPAKAVTVTATFTARTDVVLSKDATYISRNGKTDSNENDVNTQVTTNYNDAATLLAGLQGNYNAMALYKFDAPTIPADKEIASAKLTFTVAKMNNTNGDSSIDVNYPDVSTGIDFSTITWMTVFTQDTMTAPTESVWTHVQDTAPFKNVTKLATINLAKAETNVTHSDVDVTSYVKAQTKKNEEMVLVLNQCSRGANLDRVAMIEYTLQDKTYEAKVTAPAETDGTITVDKAAYNKDETATITVTAKPGKKVAGVKVMNGDTEVIVTPGENGTYTFTMPEADVTVSATFERADIATIEVAGPRTVTSAATSTYTAVAKAADGTVLEGVTFTWSVTGGTDATTAITAEGVLTVAEAEADNAPLTIKAEAEGKEGTLAASVTKATVYTITKADDIVGGSVATDRIVGIEGAEVVVTPTAATGYQVATVTYTPAEGTAQTITAAEGVYKFTMPAANVTVSATFTKVDYAITNATAADAGGTISFTVGENTAATTAQMGDTVTVVGTSADKEIDTITVVPTTEGSTTTVTVAGNTFVMPAEPVTVTATFAEPVPKFMEFADGKIQAVTVSKNNADKTYAQLKKAEATLADVKVAEGVLLADQGKLEGGKYSSLADAATIIKVDASSAGTSKVELGFKATCTVAGKNSDVRIAKIDISDIGAATYNTIAGIAAAGGATIGNGNASGVSMKYDITADIAADDDKVLYYVIYTYTARQQKLTDLALTVTPLYTATVTVKDNAETPAAVEGAAVTIKNGDTTVATGTTTAEGTFSANLEAGSYTVDVEKDGYAKVTGTALTVAAESANSVNITLEAQSDPTFPVTVNTAPFASVKLNAGTSTAGTEVVTQTVTANESGVATLADVPAGSYTVDVTPANAYLQAQTGVALNAVKDTPVTIALAYKDANMVYGEDFGGYTGLAVWDNGGSTRRNSTIADEDGNKYIQGKATGKQVAHVVHDFGTAIPLTGNTVTVEYDFRVSNHTTGVVTGDVSLGDSDNNVVLTVGQKSSTWNMAYYTGGTFDLAVASGNWGVNSGAASAIEVKAADGETEAFNGTGWYHITIVFADGKATLTVTDKTDTTKTKTISDIEVASTNIQKIKLGVGKVFGGSNATTADLNAGDLDNITITSVAAN